MELSNKEYQDFLDKVKLERLDMNGDDIAIYLFKLNPEAYKSIQKIVSTGKLNVNFFVASVLSGSFDKNLIENKVKKVKMKKLNP